MIKRTTFGFGIIALVLAIAGCDFPQFRDNIIEYQGSEFQIENFYVVDWGVNGSGFDVGFYVTEDSLTLDSNADFVGSGTYVFAEAHLSSGTIQEGDYSWNSEVGRILHLVHDAGIHVDHPAGTGLKSATFANLVITKTDITNEWIVEFTIQTPDGDIEAYYRGDITNVISATK